MQIFNGIDICPPAFIYVVFSITQICFDLFEGLYNTAVMKTVVMITVGFMLHALCKAGLSIISWIIVFVPFLLMSVIIAMLLYFFGLKETTGTTEIVDIDQGVELYQYNFLPRKRKYRRRYCSPINQPYYHGLSQNQCLQYPA
jgi:hypothetical protein